MIPLNPTHDPSLTSWVTSANDSPDFTIQNLPHGVFRSRTEADSQFRGGVAIGQQILDLQAAIYSGAFDGFEPMVLAAAKAAAHNELNDFMSMGREAWSALRAALSEILRTGSPHAPKLALCLVPQSDAQMRVPARIGDYTDMYTSIHHASNIGKLFRPDNPLTPNFQWMPIGYHGRVSSIDVSGQSFRRPQGQSMPPGATQPVFGPCKRMDYELEIGIWVGKGNALCQPVELAQAEEHVFGLCLLNDWSARDIQAWEYQPLGPFLGKNFATTISPWIVTMEALAPFRAAWTRPAHHPQPLAYLEAQANRDAGGFDVMIESWIHTAQMKQAVQSAHRLSHSNFSHSYWTVAQMLTHHTVGGCNLQAGDLIGSGTQSGPTETEAAALIELSVGGKKPVALTGGEIRTFLEDGDTIILKAWCEKPGAARIGFGECVGTVLAAQ